MILDIEKAGYCYPAFSFFTELTETKTPPYGVSFVCDLYIWFVYRSQQVILNTKNGMIFLSHHLMLSQPRKVFFSLIQGITYDTIDFGYLVSLHHCFLCMFFIADSLLEVNRFLFVQRLFFCLSKVCFSDILLGFVLISPDGIWFDLLLIRHTVAFWSHGSNRVWENIMIRIWGQVKKCWFVRFLKGIIHH